MIDEAIHEESMSVTPFLALWSSFCSITSTHPFPYPVATNPGHVNTDDRRKLSKNPVADQSSPISSSIRLCEWNWHYLALVGHMSQPPVGPGAAQLGRCRHPDARVAIAQQHENRNCDEHHPGLADDLACDEV